MEPKQRRFLNARFREIAQQQPELKVLKRLLLRIGGVTIVPLPDLQIPLLINYGFVNSGPVLMKRMAASGCHYNVAALWKKRKHNIVGIGTGYALTSDGLWRQHSWGIRREGIIETTVSWLKYFGIVLQGCGADTFAEHNPG